MAQFYVTFDSPEGPCMAVVVAPERPADLCYASIDAMIAAMDALDQEWQLRSQVRLPPDSPAVSREWLEQMAQLGRLKELSKPHGSLVGSRGAEGFPSD